MKKICVYCSASSGLENLYLEEAYKTGEILAKNGFDLVYGGSDFGLMGQTAKAFRANGAHVLGIMPRKIYDMIEHTGSNCDEFVLTDDMRERKAKMDEMSDAAVALPGGFGTLEEISEILDQKIVGYNTKPIVFLNTNGFYDKLQAFFDNLIDENFARKQTAKLYYFAKTPEELVEYLKNYVPNEPPKSAQDIYAGKV